MDQGNRIDSRARGNATQMLEKYKKMAHDAQMNGDRVATEYYLQFADHYFRVLADNRARQDEYRRPREDQGRDAGSDYADDDEDNGGYSGGQTHGQRSYAPASDQGDDHGSGHGQDDDQDDGDDNRGNARNGNRQNDTNRHDGNRSDGNRNDGRQNDGRRERRPRDDREDNRDSGGHDNRAPRPRGDRDSRPPRTDTRAEPRAEEAQAAVHGTDGDDQQAAPRRTLRGRGRPPRAADAAAEGNGLDPMILPPAIGSATDAPEAEAAKPKRRAAPRRKAAESGDVEAAAADS